MNTEDKILSQINKMAKQIEVLTQLVKQMNTDLQKLKK